MSNRRRESSAYGFTIPGPPGATGAAGAPGAASTVPGPPGATGAAGAPGAASTVPGPPGSAAAGGADRQVQFNNATTIAGASKVGIGTSGNLILESNATQPVVPPASFSGLYMRNRAGQDMLEIQRDSGREIPMQESFALNRVGLWSPASGSTVTFTGIPRSAVGTASTPTIAATNFSTSVRRWRMQSAATANAVADERAATNMVGRGNVNYPGGWFFVTRISLAALQATGAGFFGLASSTGAFSTTQTIAALTNIIGFGFTLGTDTNWQCLRNDGAGTPTAVDMGAAFPVSSLTNVYTLFIGAGRRANSIFVRAVNEVTGDVFTDEYTTDIVAATTFLNPRHYLNNGGVAAFVAYECSGVYLSSDF